MIKVIFIVISFFVSSIAQAQVMDFSPTQAVAGKSLMISLTSAGENVTSQYDFKYIDDNPSKTEVSISQFNQKPLIYSQTAGAGYKIEAKHKTTGETHLFNLDVAPSDAVKLVLIQGNSQKAPAGSILPAKMQVLVVDNFNNPVSGVDVNWSSDSEGVFTSSGLKTVIIKSNADGISEAEYQLGSVPKSETIIAENVRLTRGPKISFSQKGTEGANGPTQLSFLNNSFSGHKAEILPEVKVMLLTSSGTVAESSTNSITISTFKNSTCTFPSTVGALSGTTTVNAVTGTATFTNLSYSQIDTIYLKATSPGLAPVCTRAIAITEPQLGPSKVELAVVPDAAMEAKPFFPQVKAEIKDRNGRIVESATNEVVVSAFSDSQCSIPAASALEGVTTESASSGSVYFSKLSYPVISEIYIKASATGLESACSKLVSITEDSTLAPAKLSYKTVPSNMTAYKPSATAAKVMVSNKFNAIITKPHKVSLTAHSDAACSVPASGELAATTGLTVDSSGGYATFSGISYSEPGTIYLKVSINQVSACSQSIVVGEPEAGTAAKLAFKSDHSLTGATNKVLKVNPVVEIQDALGNKITQTASVSIDTFSDSSCSTVVINSFKLTAFAVNGALAVKNVKFPVASNYYLQAKSGNSLKSACSKMIEIVEDSPLVVSKSTDSIMVGQTAQITASGGIKPYAFSISSGGATVDATGVVTGVSAGESKIKVTDYHGAVSEVTISVIQGLAIEPVSPIAIDEGETKQFSATGGFPPYVFSVSSSGLMSQEGLFSGISSGNYAVTVTDSRSNTAMSNISVVTPLSIALTYPSKIVKGTEVQFTGSGGVAPYTWSVSVGEISSNGKLLNPQTVGVVTITLRDSRNKSITAEVEVIDGLIISPNDPQQIMIGDTIQFTSTGGVGPYSYSVDIGGTVNSSGLFTAVTATGVGSATITVTDSYGQNSTAMVSVVDSLAFSPNYETSVEINGSVNFSAVGGIPPYVFSSSIGSMSGGAFTAPATAGMATITLRDSKNHEVSVNVNVLDSFSISPIEQQQIMVGETIQYSVSGGVPPYSFSVDVGGNISQEGLFTATESTGLGLATVTVTDSNLKTATAKVSVVAILAFAPTYPTTIGVNGTIDFNGVGGTPPYTFSSSTGSMVSSSFTAPSTPGISTITLIDSKNREVTVDINVVDVTYIAEFSAYSENTVTEICSGSATGTRTITKCTREYDSAVVDNSNCSDPTPQIAYKSPQGEDGGRVVPSGQGLVFKTCQEGSNVVSSYRFECNANYHGNVAAVDCLADTFTAQWSSTFSGCTAPVCSGPNAGNEFKTLLTCVRDHDVKAVNKSFCSSIPIPTQICSSPAGSRPASNFQYGTAAERCEFASTSWVLDSSSIQCDSGYKLEGVSCVPDETPAAVFVAGKEAAYTYVVQSDSSVWSWLNYGDSAREVRLSNGDPLTGVSLVGTSGTYACGKKGSKILCWMAYGNGSQYAREVLMDVDSNGVADDPLDATDVVSIIGGTNGYFAAVTSNGAVWSWSNYGIGGTFARRALIDTTANGSGDTPFTGVSEVESGAVGYFCGKKDSKVFCWYLYGTTTGYAREVQVDLNDDGTADGSLDSSNIIKIQGNSSNYFYALNSDGSVWAWQFYGTSTTFARKVKFDSNSDGSPDGNISGVLEIAAGGSANNYTCGRTATRIWCWTNYGTGSNSARQIYWDSNSSGIGNAIFDASEIKNIYSTGKTYFAAISSAKEVHVWSGLGTGASFIGKVEKRDKAPLSNAVPVIVGNFGYGCLAIGPNPWCWFNKGTVTQNTFARSVLFDGDGDGIGESNFIMGSSLAIGVADHPISSGTYSILVHGGKAPYSVTLSPNSLWGSFVNIVNNAFKLFPSGVIDEDVIEVVEATDSLGKTVTKNVKILRPLTEIHGDGTVGSHLQLGERYPLTKFGNKYLYYPTNSSLGVELWITDGTQSGTFNLKDIRPGTTSSNIRNITVVNSLAFFTAVDGTNGSFSSLWATNGTQAGTYKVTNSVTNLNSLISFNGLVYFTSDYSQKIWSSDGTEVGTSMVVLAPSGHIFEDLKIMNGSIYTVTSAYFTSGIRSYHLYKLTGSSLELIKTLGNLNEGFVSMLTTENKIAIFTKKHVNVSDGTVGGTQLLKIADSGYEVSVALRIGSDFFYSEENASLLYSVFSINGTSNVVDRLINPTSNRQLSDGKEINGRKVFVAGPTIMSYNGLTQTLLESSSGQYTRFSDVILENGKTFIIIQNKVCETDGDTLSCDTQLSRYLKKIVNIYPYFGGYLLLDQGTGDVSYRPNMIYTYQIK